MILVFSIFLFPGLVGVWIFLKYYRKSREELDDSGIFHSTLLLIALTTMVFLITSVIKIKLSQGLGNLKEWEWITIGLGMPLFVLLTILLFRRWLPEPLAKAIDEIIDNIVFSLMRT